jgi:hypothetical protein
MEEDLKFLNMEDDLKNIKNGRRPNFFKKHKTNSKMEDDIKNFNKQKLKKSFLDSSQF